MKRPQLKVARRVKRQTRSKGFSCLLRGKQVGVRLLPEVSKGGRLFMGFFYEGYSWAR